MFSVGVFLNFKAFFSPHSHAADMFSVDTPGAGWGSGVRGGPGTHEHDRCAPHMRSHDACKAD